MITGNSTATDNSFRNFAFISYSHKDMAVAKWLQRRLESFRLPTEIHNEIDAQSRYIRPVFRDQSDLDTGILGDELHKHLEQSKYLIIICSKHSANSAWVSQEAKAFAEKGGLGHIIPVIISDGALNERDLFPEYLRNYFSEHPDKELLGISLNESGKEKSLIKIVSRMLGVSFDSLWKRHRRQKNAKIATITTLSFILATLIYNFAVPVNLSISVNPQQSNLPHGDLISMLVDGGKYSIDIESPIINGIKLPGYKRFNKINLKVSSPFYSTVDTIVNISYGINQKIDISLDRDDSFGIFAGHVFNERMEPFKDVIVKVNGFITTTTDEGYFCIKIPLTDQQEELPLSMEYPNYKYNFNGELHSPGKDIKVIMHPY